VAGEAGAEAGVLNPARSYCMEAAVLVPGASRS